ncbi:MAG: formyl-CoA transferase, partial [Chloroflexi bacterium]|nr:formyl-CoA transferase [Chloroflexota bacterium]
PELGEAITYQGSPFKSSEMSWQYWRRAPFIGEHNKEIYAGELKLNSREMVLLKEGGVI